MDQRREGLRGPCKWLFVTATLVLLSRSIHAAVIPAESFLEVRLSSASGSRISHPGDAIDATVIAPLFAQGHLLIPQGAVVSGTVAEVGRLGFGVKHVTSDLRYQFDSLRFADGTSVPIRAEVAQVETAKERVDQEGVVGGIYPTANLSSSLASYVIPLLWIDPNFGWPFLGIKVVIARSPDPEIYFPAGTELLLRLLADASLPPHETFAGAVQPLSGTDMADAHQIFSKLPQQHATRGNHPSDLINILFLGNRDAVDRAFRAAGWSGAQRSSLLSIFRMYHCMVQRIGYSMAPMGKLTLNGARSDADYQKSLDTFSKRHHVRLWAQGREAWLTSATEDVGYRLRNMHLTHATDPMIDNERNKVINDVAFTGCLQAAAMVPRPTADQATTAQTDGRIAVLRLNDCRRPKMMPDEGSLGNPQRRRRSTQALIALRNDLIRNNPVFLAYNSVRLLCDRRGVLQAGSTALSGSRRIKSGTAKPPVQNAWLRPSVLETEALSK